MEAATDTELLFVKPSAFLSIASREVRVANFLLIVTSNKLRRANEYGLLLGRSVAKCRVAKFLIDLCTRLGKAKYLDVPMSHQDITDHLGLTIETVSRAITDLERAGLITRSVLPIWRSAIRIVSEISTTAKIVSRLDT